MTPIEDDDDPWLDRIRLLAEQLRAKASELVDIVEAEQQERGANGGTSTD
ncbi:MAG TPA: hypothetical protein VIV12_13375 [Streptosporangiaceae bacterium]